MLLISSAGIPSKPGDLPDFNWYMAAVTSSNSGSGSGLSYLLYLLTELLTVFSLKKAAAVSFQNIFFLVIYATLSVITVGACLCYFLDLFSTSGSDA